MTWFLIALVVAIGGIWAAYTRSKGMKAADAAARAQIPPAPSGGPHIDVNDPAEVSRWTKELGVDEWDLKDAIRDVGQDADAVKKHLGAR